MSKGECVACHRPVLVGATRLAGASPTWVEYGSKIWHKVSDMIKLTYTIDRIAFGVVFVTSN
jgi:hypothetical protein